jgi:hypothetical protein
MLHCWPAATAAPADLTHPTSHPSDHHPHYAALQTCNPAAYSYAAVIPTFRPTQCGR